MARTITFLDVLANNEIVAQVAEVNDSQFNPVERTSKVSLYCKSDIVGGSFSFFLGGELHASQDVLPITTTSLSTRDHLVATGVARRGQKITVGLNNTEGAATPAVQGMIVIEPLA